MGTLTSDGNLTSCVETQVDVPRRSMYFDSSDITPIHDTHTHRQSQEADYLLPLPPLTKFAVRTTATTDETNKYLYFTHDFVSEDGETLYCKANVKAIVKEMSGKSKGKTVRPMHMQSLTSMQWLS